MNFLPLKGLYSVKTDWHLKTVERGIINKTTKFRM
jgi:hypothetical protein